MQNWTDKIIHWNQLPGTEVKRLLDTWGKTPAEIARYDKKHGYVNSAPVKAHVSNTDNPVDFPKTAPKKAVPKTVAKPATRQKHTGADGADQVCSTQKSLRGVLWWQGGSNQTHRRCLPCRVAGTVWN
jgi:hypothetical protein